MRWCPRNTFGNLQGFWWGGSFLHYFSTKGGDILLVEMPDDLPVGREYLKRFLEKSLVPALSRGSNTMFYMPGTGRTSYFRYLSENRAEIEKRFGIELGTLVFLMVQDSDEKRTVTEWRRMIGEQKVDLPGTNWNNALPEDVLIGLTREKDRRVLLSAKMGDEGPTVPQLIRYRGLSQMQIDLQFSFPFELTVEELGKNLGELAILALQGVWYLPLLNRDEAEPLFNLHGTKALAEEAKADIFSISGGYPVFIRYFLRNLEKVSVHSWAEPELKLLLDELWEALSPSSQNWLFSYFHGKMTEDPSRYLLDTGMVYKDVDGYRIFSPLIKDFVLALEKESHLKITEQQGKVFISGKDVATLLSVQELAIFKLLWEKKGEIVSREDLSGAMWGEAVQEKYSDWAINQLIRRIRRKIGDNKRASVIGTIRDRGFVFRI